MLLRTGDPLAKQLIIALLGRGQDARDVADPPRHESGRLLFSQHDRKKTINRNHYIESDDVKYYTTR